jgi:hypothetical protein
MQEIAEMHKAAAEWEKRAEDSLKAAGNVPVGDPEGPEILADAQASATLAQSIRLGVIADVLGNYLPGRLS